jgi:hypothetical protein
MCTLLPGGTVILPGRFEPSVMLDVIARRRPTTAFCVLAPAHARFSYRGDPAKTAAAWRDALRLGPATTRNGLRLAPVLNNLSPSMWTAHHCQTVLCRGVEI